MIARREPCIPNCRFTDEWRLRFLLSRGSYTYYISSHMSGTSIDAFLFYKSSSSHPRQDQQLPCRMTTAHNDHQWRNRLGTHVLPDTTKGLLFAALAFFSFLSGLCNSIKCVWLTLCEPRKSFLAHFNLEKWFWLMWTQKIVYGLCESRKMVLAWVNPKTCPWLMWTQKMVLAHVSPESRFWLMWTQKMVLAYVNQENCFWLMWIQPRKCYVPVLCFLHYGSLDSQGTPWWLLGHPLVVTLIECLFDWWIGWFVLLFSFLNCRL